MFVAEYFLALTLELVFLVIIIGFSIVDDSTKQTLMSKGFSIFDKEWCIVHRPHP